MYSLLPIKLERKSHTPIRPIFGRRRLSRNGKYRICNVEKAAIVPKSTMATLRHIVGFPFYHLKMGKSWVKTSSDFKKLLQRNAFLVLRLHRGELEALALITLHNSTKPFLSLRLKTLTPRNSTQLYVGYVSIGLSRGLTA